MKLRPNGNGQSSGVPHPPRVRSSVPSLPGTPLSLPRALILAAGVGRRLDNGHPSGRHLPKALLRFGGRSLLERHCDILRRCGVQDITLVLGYGEDEVRAELDALG